MVDNPKVSQLEKDAGFREVADKLVELIEKDKAIKEEKAIVKALKKAGFTIIATLNSRLSL